MSNKKKGKQNKGSENTLRESAEMLGILLTFIIALHGAFILYGIIQQKYLEANDPVEALQEYAESPLYNTKMSILKRDHFILLKADGTYKVQDAITYYFHQDVDTIEKSYSYYNSIEYRDQKQLDQLLDVRLTELNLTLNESKILQPTVDLLDNFNYPLSGKKGEVKSYVWQYAVKSVEEPTSQPESVYVNLSTGFDITGMPPAVRACDYSFELNSEVPLTYESYKLDGPPNYFDLINLEVSEDRKSIKGVNKEFTYKRQGSPGRGGSKKDFMTLSLSDKPNTDGTQSAKIEQLPSWVKKGLRYSAILAFVIFIIYVLSPGFIRINFWPIIVGSLMFYLVKSIHEEAIVAGAGNIVEIMPKVLLTITLLASCILAISICFEPKAGSIKLVDKIVPKVILISFLCLEGLIMLGSYANVYGRIERWYLATLCFLLYGFYVSCLIPTRRIYLKKDGEIKNSSSM